MRIGTCGRDWGGRHGLRLKVRLVMVVGHMRKMLVARTAAAVDVVASTTCARHTWRGRLMRGWAVTVHRR